MKIFFDTNLFIYLLEDERGLAKSVEGIVEHAKTKQMMIFTSSLTIGETLVKPIKETRYYHRQDCAE